MEEKSSIIKYCEKNSIIFMKKIADCNFIKKNKQQNCRNNLYKEYYVFINKCIKKNI